MNVPRSLLREPRDDVRVTPVGRGRALVVVLPGPHDVLSWAVVNGGRREARSIVWREVARGELGLEVDARALMAETLTHLGLPDAVGLMTARDVRRYEDVTVEREGVSARCVATVGLGNALAPGDPPGLPTRPGTINVLCRVSVPLSEEALVEACALVAEARTAALMAARIPSRLSDRLASGTGTDCIVVAAPVAGDDVARTVFAGKHTACGSAVGAAVYDAIAAGVRAWQEENAWPAT